jgi:hypothetical protein
MTEPHSTSLYAPAGRGILYIAPWSGTTPPTDPDDYVEIGNCPSFECEPLQERRPHYSSRAGLRVKDLNPVVQLDYNLSFDCDEMAAANLARFFLGTLTQATGRIAAMTNYDAEYAIKFVSDNPIGPNQIYRFHRVTLGPAGPLQLIGDDYLVMSFAGEGLSDSANNPDSEYFNITYVTTTTTTSSTTTTTS